MTDMKTTSQITQNNDQLLTEEESLAIHKNELAKIEADDLWRLVDLYMRVDPATEECKACYDTLRAYWEERSDMNADETNKLTNATVEIYCPAAGENPTLNFQVRATHTSMGMVQLCYASKADADNAAKFINEFGVCPPSAKAESERRPVLTACVECGENAPESGLVCDECREDAQGD